MCSDLIDRQDVLDAVNDCGICIQRILDIPSVNTEQDDKFEYHYDHTDCIWYHDGKSRCPSTCSQYRDGWNDAMMYIFKGGPGYRPYRRNQRYEG